MTQTTRDYPSTGFVDLLRLLGMCVGDFVRAPRSFDFGLTLQAWFRGLVRRTGSENIILNLYFKRLLIVTGRELSAHILAQPPDVRGYVEGTTKTMAMSFLAPQALTITHGRQWQRLRRFNETALHAKEADARMQFILDGVRQAFQQPVTDINDIRSCMETAMQKVVFGDQASPHLAEDVQKLFRYVQNPGRRMLFGWSQVGRRKRFYDALGRLWAECSASSAPSLVATASVLTRKGIHPKEEIIQQIPHWMFTFTGSGTNLLARTLGMVVARDGVYGRVRTEAVDLRAKNCASAVMNMDYLDSCLLETCRLFPPVTRTFHVSPQGDVFHGVNIPAGMEILHCFTANQRDISVDATANEFRPERWMDPGNDACAIYPGLFLGGARNCPGKGLILFVCKVAIATLMDHGRLRSQCPALSEDPLPYSFPEDGLQFSTDSG